MFLVNNSHNTDVQKINMKIPLPLNTSLSADLIGTD